MGDWGMRFSQDGYSALLDNDRRMIFTTSHPTIKILVAGNLTVTIASGLNEGSTSVIVPHALGTTFSWAPAGVATTLLNGKRYRTNTPGLYSTVFASPNDQHYFSVQGSVSFVLAKVTFIVGRLAGASTVGTTETFNVRYFILAEN